MKVLNVILPDEIDSQLETISNKSSFIVEALKEKLEKKRENEELDELLIEGYNATNEEDKKLNEEWERITLEKW